MHTGHKGKPTQEPNHCIGQGAVETFCPDEATWEMEDAMKQAYPILFTSAHTHHIDR
jgi:hypothetical protein